MKTIFYDNTFDRLEEIRNTCIEDMGEDGRDVEEQALENYVEDYLYLEHRDFVDALNRLDSNTIIAIADLGLWNGRRMGYKLITNFEDIAYNDYDINQYGYDAYNFVHKGIHHDGTNYITYREIKEEMSDTQLENFTNKLYNGTATKQDITRYTRTLKNRIEL